MSVVLSRVLINWQLAATAGQMSACPQKRTLAVRPRHVRFGSEADIRAQTCSRNSGSEAAPRLALFATGALPCQQRGASHRLARSKYTFFTTERSPRLAADARTDTGSGCPQPEPVSVRCWREQSDRRLRLALPASAEQTEQSKPTGKQRESGREWHGARRSCRVVE